MILNSPYISGSLTVTNLSGSGVRYLMTSASGLLISQTADAAIKNTYTASATAGQTVFPVTNGYSTGLVDVYLNGTKLASSDYSDADGVNITLITGSDAGDLLEFVKYSPALGVTNNALRQLTTFTSSEGQTVYSASYTPGLLDVYYNGSRLTSAEYTANNGTFITLATGSVAGDIVDLLVYSYQVGAFSGVGGTGTANQVAYWGTTNAITGSPNFTVSGSTLAVTGSFTVITGSAAEFTVNPTGVRIGNVSTDTHTITGSLNVTGGINLNSGSILSVYRTDNTRALQLYTTVNECVIDSWEASSEPLMIRSNGSGGRIVFHTSGSEKMRITSAGNIGIGTTSPTSSLDVRVAVESPATNRIALAAGTSNGANDIFRWYDGTTQLGVFKNSGNIGIGTTAPGDKLVVVGANNIWAGNFVGTSSTNASFGVQVLAGTSGNDTCFRCVNGAQTIELFKIRGDGAMFTGTATLSPYNNTTGGAANLTVGVDGGLARSTSSIKYKKDVRDYDKGLAEVLQMRPVYYKGKSENDSDKQYAGLIAEEINELGLEEFVVYAEDGSPDALAYQNMIALLTKAIQEQQAKITALEEKLERNNIQ